MSHNPPIFQVHLNLHVGHVLQHRPGNTTGTTNVPFPYLSALHVDVPFRLNQEDVDVGPLALVERAPFGFDRFLPTNDLPAMTFPQPHTRTQHPSWSQPPYFCALPSSFAVSSRPPDSSNPTHAVRSRSSCGESSNPVHLPLRSTPISAPTDPGSENPPPNPEPRPKNKQRIHVTVSETHGETITALRLTSGGGRPIEPPTSDDSDSGLRSRTPPAASASAHST